MAGIRAFDRLSGLGGIGDQLASWQRSVSMARGNFMTANTELT